MYTVLTGVKAALAYKPHPDFEPKKKKKKKFFFFFFGGGGGGGEKTQ